MTGASVSTRVMQRCDELAEISSLSDGICRIYLSPEHRRANDLVASWMRDAGLTVREDTVGNVIGRLGPDDLPTLMVGSHLDSVPYAGRYDGILGVMLGLELADSFAPEDLPFALEIIGFGEEEGVRFGTTLVTSRAVANDWDPSWFELVDAYDQSLSECYRSFGLDPERVGEAACQPLAFLEVHIEQGPVLEAHDLSIAPVTAIAGARRFEFTLGGMAAHAGTTPMSMRRDALAAASEMVLAIEAVAIERRVLATVGRLQVGPDAVNVVPGQVMMSLDIRAGSDADRDEAFDEILQRAQNLCAARAVELNVEQLHEAKAVACAEPLIASLSDAVAASGLEVLPMDSGAGHDAMAMALACPVGMMFVRCAGGVSHNPEESVDPDDVDVAFNVLRDWVVRIAEQHPIKAIDHGQAQQQ